LGGVSKGHSLGSATKVYKLTNNLRKRIEKIAGAATKILSLRKNYPA